MEDSLGTLLIYLEVDFISQALRVEGVCARHCTITPTCVKMMPITQWRGISSCYSEMRKRQNKSTIFLVNVTVK